MGAYTDMDGHPTWVEDTGDGPPVLLLHGGFSNSDSMLEPFGPLAERFHLVGFDRRGHGRTADTNAPFHYADMAQETIRVLEQVVSAPCHLVGYSDGGNVALLVAQERPDLVRSLVVIGANYRADGLVPGIFDHFDPAMLRPDYAERSPDGADHFATVVDKTLAMFAAEPRMTGEDLSRIEAPALVVVGDDDIVTLAHTVSLYESLPNAQLAVIPGTSHLVVMEKPALVNQLVAEFLTSGGATQRLMPITRGT